MPIKRRLSGGGKGGGIKPAPSSRPKKAGIKPRKISKPYPEELGALIALWDKEAPGTIRRLTKRVSYGRVGTGILGVDLCLAGGFKRSRANMIVGERSSGKSTIVGKAIATALRENPDEFAAIIDIEGTVDKVWYEKLGCDADRIIIVEPDTGEGAVDQVDALLRTDHITYVVMDSIAMITPFKEIDSSAEDNQIAIQARLVGKMLRRVQNALLQERKRGHHPVLSLINQFRMKAGLAFGDPRTFPGGKALEFVTSQQLEVKNKEHLSDTGLVMFNEHSIHITKDKTGGRYRDAKFKLIRDESAKFPVGYVQQGETIREFAERIGMAEGKTVQIPGARPHTYKNKDEWQRFLFENPDVETLLVQTIIQHYTKLWEVDG